jgi:hypothetical protein
MKSLSSHLKDKIKFGFTVNNTKSDRIMLFDLDDTLINTTAKILLMKNNKLIKKLHNSEFNDYILKPGEYFDFEEFNNPDILSSSHFTKYWNTLKREYQKGTHIGILTARSDCDMIKNFLLNNGIRIKDELIMAINDPKLGLHGTIQQKKSDAIKILANAGYNTFIFFDDNEGNLVSAKKLEKEYNIVVKTVKV